MMGRMIKPALFFLAVSAAAPPALSAPALSPSILSPSILSPSVLPPAAGSASPEITTQALGVGQLKEAAAAFHRGDFVQAAHIASNEGSAAGFAFAARALLIHGDLIAPAGKKLSVFERAAAFARVAVSLKPELDEGHLQLAVALGMIGRQEGNLMAHMAGYGNEARAHLDLVLERRPGNVWANALLGGWHLEIAHEGGMLGTALYSADAEQGLALYRRALSLDPTNQLIAYQFALQLLLMGEANRAEALTALTIARAYPANGAMGLMMKKRADQLYQTIETGREGDIVAMVDWYTGRAPEQPPEQGASGQRAIPRHDIRPSIGSPR